LITFLCGFFYTLIVRDFFSCIDSFWTNWDSEKNRKKMGGDLKQFFLRKSVLLKVSSLNSREIVQQYPLYYNEQLECYCKIGINSTSSFWNSRELEFHVFRIVWSRVLVNSKIISEANTPSSTVYPYSTRHLIKKWLLFPLNKQCIIYPTKSI